MEQGDCKFGIVLKTDLFKDFVELRHKGMSMALLFIPCFKCPAEIATPLAAEAENNSQNFRMPFA